MKKLIISIGLLLATFNINAGPHYLSGKMSNIASSNDGLSIMMTTGVPENCQGVPHNWMKVKVEDSAMVSMLLAMWMSGKTSMTVYTYMENNRCYINQVDPAFYQ